MLVLCCCCASVPCPLALLRDAFSLPDLPFLAFCFCHLPLLFCPWFFALCCSCSSLSGSSAPLLVLCCSFFPALPVWLLLLLLFFVSWVLLLFNRNWNVGKFGFYSREGVLWCEALSPGVLKPSGAAFGQLPGRILKLSTFRSTAAGPRDF